MNWFKRLLMGLLPPVGTAIAKRFAATHAIVVAVTVFALASPVIHGEMGLGGLCVLFAWLGLAALHVESAFNGALSRYAGGTAALAVSLMAGCAVGWVGLPLLLAVLVGSIVVIGLGIGWRRGMRAGAGPDADAERWRMKGRPPGKSGPPSRGGKGTSAVAALNTGPRPRSSEIG